MGTCTSVPSSPNGNGFDQCDTFRIRQLDGRLRKKAVMTLRISETDLIIEAKGRRGQPELIASLLPDSSRYSLQRYGVPDIPVPAILIDLKGYDRDHDNAQYVFFCRNNSALFERLQDKVKQSQKKTSTIRASSIRSTPLPTPVAPITPTPFFPNLTPNEVAQPFNPSNRLSSTSTTTTEHHNYYNDPARDEQNKLMHKGSSQSFKNSGVFNQTPLSPVPETDHGGGMKPIKLALAPKNRDEMLSRRNEQHGSVKLHPQPWNEFPKPPPRNTFYQNSGNDFSRTSLSTRSSGQNINQLSARSDCEPLLLSNLSTPNQNMRGIKPNSAEHIYVNTANPNETGPRTPSFHNPSGPFTAPAGPQHRRFFFPPMDALHRDDLKMNYVTVEHNSLSSTNSTPRTPKTPGVTVQYTPVDFQKTDELRKSQRSIVRSDSKQRSRSNLIQK